MTISHFETNLNEKRRNCLSGAGISIAKATVSVLDIHVAVQCSLIGQGLVTVQ